MLVSLLLLGALLGSVRITTTVEGRERYAVVMLVYLEQTWAQIQQQRQQEQRSVTLRYLYSASCMVHRSGCDRRG